MTKGEQVGIELLRNELARVNGELAELREEKFPAGEWVRAEDYDKLADAANRLRAECKMYLPPGWYDKLTSLSDLDEILRQQKDTCSPSTSTTPPQFQPDSAPPAGR